MSESDFFKTTATEHHKKHHRTASPNMPSKEDKENVSVSKHEDNNHDATHEEGQPKERTVMKNKITSTVASLVLAMVSIFGVATNVAAFQTAAFKADKFQFQAKGFQFQTDKFQFATFRADKFQFEADKFQAKGFQFQTDKFQMDKFQFDGFQT